MKVGLVGLGLMGTVMATRLVQAGHEVLVRADDAAVRSVVHDAHGLT
jgi:3-hydroxyisobutyrate dehydrogenase-like beta-hydroxyacid dehydrogenase